MRTLTYEEIRPLLVGGVEVEEGEDGIHVRKCTSRQIAAWEAESAFLGTTSRATSGVRLEFRTNSRRMRFAFSSGRKVELRIDGLLRAQYDMNAMREQGEYVEVALTDCRGEAAEELTVTLTFPSHDDPGVLSLLSLEDEAYAKPCDYDCRILFLGDSITQGWAAEYDSESYAYRVSRFFNAHSVIQGVGGGVFLRSTWEKVDYDPDIVVVAFGTNDVTHSSREFFEEHAAYVLGQVASAYRGRKIFVISPIWRGHSDGRPMEENFVGYRTWLEDYVRAQKGLILIPGLSLVPPLPMYYQDTYLHPNDLGFAVYAENLIRQMQKHL